MAPMKLWSIWQLKEITHGNKKTTKNRRIRISTAETPNAEATCEISPLTTKSDQLQTLQPHQKLITLHSMKNLAFHGLLAWKMITLPILTTSSIHYFLKGWGKVLFELGSERVTKGHEMSWHGTNLISAPLAVYSIVQRKQAQTCPHTFVTMRSMWR